jgi:hypothetical protein
MCPSVVLPAVPDENYTVAGTRGRAPGVSYWRKLSPSLTWFGGGN